MQNQIMIDFTLIHQMKNKFQNIGYKIIILNFTFKKNKIKVKNNISQNANYEYYQKVFNNIIKIKSNQNIN